MNLLIVEERDLSPEREFTVGGEHAEHIFCILHAKPGDVIRAGILGGGIGTARILETARHSARLRMEDTSSPPPPPSNILPVIALNHHLLTEGSQVTDTNHLRKHGGDDRAADTCDNVFRLLAVALFRDDGAVHEHGATGPQLRGALGVEGQFCNLFHRDA